MIASYKGLLDKDEFSKVLQFLKIKFVMLDNDIKSLPQLDQDLITISRLRLSEFKTNMKSIKQTLQNKRHNYHLIEVEPKSAGLASFAVQDNRVDIIKLNPTVGLKIINSRYAKRLIENKKILSLDLKLFKQKYPSKDLRQYLRFFAAFGSKKVPTYLEIMTSDPYEMRSYRGLQALGRIMGLPDSQTTFQHILERVELNKRKISGEIPFPGVEIIGRQD